MKQYISIIGFTILAFGACKKEINPEVSLDREPKIKILSVAPTTIQEFDESVIVTLQYEDGDGNLGFEHPDSNALRVWDDRLQNPDFYFVPPLSPVGEEISIRGALEIRLNGTFIIGTGTEESTRFAISIKDRDGNWSNEVTTPIITIQK
jgi:hypothetical protein